MAVFVWEWNRHAMAELLSSPAVIGATKDAAEAIAESARAIAPVGKPGPPDYDKHPGRYKASIEVVRSGVGKDGRPVFDVHSELPYAAFVEGKYGVLHKAVKMHRR